MHKGKNSGDEVECRVPPHSKMSALDSRLVPFTVSPSGGLFRESGARVRSGFEPCREIFEARIHLVLYKFVKWKNPAGLVRRGRQNEPLPARVLKSLRDAAQWKEIPLRPALE